MPYAVPLTYKDVPRPKPDTGIGFHDSNQAGSNPFGANGKANWDNLPSQQNDINAFKEHARRLKKAGRRWYKLLADGDNKTLRAMVYILEGIEVIVRLYAHQPHPDYIPDPNHVKQYVRAGVKFFEIGNEPNLVEEADPADWTTDANEWGKRIADQWIRASKVVVENGGIPVFYAMTPGGHINHRTLTLAVLNYLRNKTLANGKNGLTILHNAVIGIHPRPLNNPPDAKVGTGNPPNTTTWLEYTWYIETYTAYLGYTPGFFCTEHGYSPVDNQNHEHPAMTAATWAEYNAELDFRMNPAHPKATHPAIIAICYWLEINEGPGGVWIHDAPFGDGRSWIGDGVQPNDRAWGKKIWEIAPYIIWDRSGFYNPLPPGDGDGDGDGGETPVTLPSRILTLIGAEPNEPFPAWITFENANVAPGQRFNRLVRVEIVGHKLQDKQNAFIMSPYNGSLSVRWLNTTTNTTDTVPLVKTPPDPAADVPIWGNGNRYTFSIEGNGLPSDKIKNVMLPGNLHWAYYLYYEVVTMPEIPVPDPNATPSYVTRAFDLMTQYQIRITPTFALPAVILAHNTRNGDNQKGYEFVLGETRFPDSGKTYAFVGAQHPVTQDKLISISIDGVWGPAITLWHKSHTTGKITKVNNPLSLVETPVVKETPVPTPSTYVVKHKSVKLDVPYATQLDPERAKYGIGDCGPTAAEMIIRFFGLDTTADRIALIMGLPRDYRVVYIEPLVKAINRLGKEVGIVAKAVSGGMIADLLARLDRGLPSIPLVTYEAMPFKGDANYKGGHFLVVVGYEVQEDGSIRLLFHDPYWKPGNLSGRYMWMSIDAFYKCWADTTYNAACQYVAIDKA